jgi:phosphoenolpyruvate carboxykinase (GTP)
VVRRDPMAMKPFAGYNFGDYFGHWLTMGKALKYPPQVFHVNWFRQDAKGEFMWPGFGDNLRVLAWILERCAGRVGSQDAPIGHLPNPADLKLDGLAIDTAVVTALTSVPAESLRHEVASFRKYLNAFGTHAPSELYAELDEVERRLG